MKDKLIYLAVGAAIGYYLARQRGAVTGLITHTKQANPTIAVAGGSVNGYIGRGWEVQERPTGTPCVFRRAILTT